MVWHSPKEQQDAALDTAASPRDLHLLSQSEYGFVRVAVACNVNTADDDLERLIPSELSNYTSQEVCLAIANNPSASVRTLSALASRLEAHVGGDRDDRVAFAAGVQLCRHSNAPLESLMSLVESGSTQFRKVVARETTRAEILDFLREDPSSTVQRAVSRRSDI